MGAGPEQQPAIHTGLNHFVSCLDAHCAHQGQLPLHNRGFKGPYRSGGAGILIRGDFTFINLYY